MFGRFPAANKISKNNVKPIRPDICLLDTIKEYAAQGVTTINIYKKSAPHLFSTFYIENERWLTKRGYQIRHYRCNEPDEYFTIGWN